MTGISSKPENTHLLNELSRTGCAETPVVLSLFSVCFQSGFLTCPPFFSFFPLCHSCSEGFGVDAKPKLASHHQIFLAPSEEERGSLPTPDDGNLWHVLSVA